MEIREFNNLLQQLRKRPAITSFSLVIIVSMFIAASWLSGYVGKKGESAAKPKQQTTFRFDNFADDSLRSLIEESTGYSYDLSDKATYVIGFSHTGTLLRGSSDGKYRYEGGVVVIQVNGSTCAKINDLRIKSWPDYPGNPKEALLPQIDHEIKSLVSDNPETVLKALQSCFGHE